MSQYFEETQDTLNDYINLQQFKTIVWENGMP